MSNSRKIKFGVVGFGHIGRRHAEEIDGNENAVLNGIADISDKALKEAVSHDCPKYNSLEDLFLSGKELDVISVCTPNGLHIAQAEQAINAGINVLVEKPLGLKKEDCNRLIDLAKSKDKQIFCALQNRYSPQVKFLKDFISAGKLGEIYWLDIACYWNRDERYYRQDSWRGTAELDGGTLFTQFSHFVDLLYWIFGDVKPTGGVFGNFNHNGIIEFEDTGSFHFDLPNHKAKGVFSYSTSVPQKNLESSITIIGSKGSLRLGGQYMNSIDYFSVEGEKEPALPLAKPANQYGTYQGSAANHNQVIENVIRSLRGEPAEIARAEEAAASVGIIEKVYSLRKL